MNLKIFKIGFPNWNVWENIVIKESSIVESYAIINCFDLLFSIISVSSKFN